MSDDLAKKSNSSLIKAIKRRRRPAYINNLLETGEDLFEKDRCGRIAVHIEARKGRHEVVTLLHSMESKLNQQHQVSACDRDARTPLHHAVISGNIEAVNVLISAGADIHAPDNEGAEPLHLAVSNQCNVTQASRMELVNSLLLHGAKPDAVDMDFLTPLHYAVLSSSNECISVLVAAGADPNAQDVNQFTPLHLAVLHKTESDHLSEIESLLSVGARDDIQDVTGSTPYDTAQQHNAIAASCFAAWRARIGAARS